KEPQQARDPNSSQFSRQVRDGVVPPDEAVRDHVQAGVDLLAQGELRHVVLGGAQVLVRSFTFLPLRDGPAQQLLLGAVADARVTAVVCQGQVHLSSILLEVVPLVKFRTSAMKNASCMSF